MTKENSNDRILSSSFRIAVGSFAQADVPEKRSRAKITTITSTGLLKGILSNPHKRRIPLEAWVADTLIGSGDIVAQQTKTPEIDARTIFEFPVDFEKAPTDWLISQDAPVLLKRTGKEKPLPSSGWRAGRLEAAEFQAIGLKRLVNEDRLHELHALAKRRNEEGFLRNALLEALGYALDRHIGLQDGCIQSCTREILSCAAHLDGIDKLVLERSAHMANIFCALTSDNGEPDGIDAGFRRIESAGGIKMISECFIESMSTPHLDSEGLLWKSRIGLLTSAVSYRLFKHAIGTRMADTPHNPRGRWNNPGQPEIQDLLRLMAEYIYTSHSQCEGSTLFYRLTNKLLSNSRLTEESYCSSTKAYLLRQIRQNRYHESIVTAVEHLKGLDEQQVNSARNDLDLSLALSELELVLSGYDFQDSFRSFRRSAKLAIKAAWGNPYGSRLRHIVDQELFMFCKRYRSIAKKLASSGIALAKARSYQDCLVGQLNRLTEEFIACPALRTTKPKSTLKRWLIIGNRDLFQCWIYRVLQKKEYLESLGLETRIVCLQTTKHGQTAWTRHLLWADGIIVCRLPYTYQTAKLYALAKSIGRPVFYEIDDLIFSNAHFPPALTSYGNTITRDTHNSLALGTGLFRYALELSEGCIVSTSCLKEYVVSEGLQPEAKTFVIGNLMLPSLRQALANDKIQYTCKSKPHDSLGIVFTSGTLAHKESWNYQLAPALAKILRKHKRTKLLLLGRIDLPSCLGPYEDRIERIPFQDYEFYIQAMSRGDIGVSVVERNAATDCKSAIKWMEYSCCGLASIVSPTDTHKREIEEKQNVLFAENTEEWISQIEFLINNPQARNKIAQRALYDAQDKYGKASGLRVYEEFVRSAEQLASGSEREAGSAQSQRKKILVINVFFRPDSHGGATRIAEQQALAASRPNTHHEDYDVTFLCQEQCNSANQEIGIIINYVENVRIVRVQLPGLKWSQYWSNKTSIPLQEMMEAWYTSERFDLIHAHCLQGVTIAPLVAAQRCNIPYIVSLHDAWWLSPYQFLTTEDGNSIDPTDACSHLGRHSSRTAAAKARKRRDDLFSVLSGADERLAVSSVFATIYRSCGLDDVKVLANRADSMARGDGPVNRRDQSETIRACFIGGISAHKGYFVLRDALLSSEVDNLVVDVVDHRLHSNNNTIRQVTWGSTCTNFIPIVPMERMSEFYSGYDMLIAPSIWPESFGLVVREALSAGLWVIASEAGALAEDIVDGVNGFRVTPRNSRDLQQKIELSVQILLGRGRSASPAEHAQENDDQTSLAVEPTHGKIETTYYVSYLHEYFHCKGNAML
ncbi:glycosyltransferase [Cyanobium sp. CH-040]|uniref:glycosyltransferase n=1 Tax=Cyanobium sp. CH-040 TaxID=2823708 RepID=UPI0020CE0F6F|nr:glycosyltransferase [Cyanobium sp. CH-040]MCP9927991.1 glycosyltransferase [Cyanobium sp. CH-040]